MFDFCKDDLECVQTGATTAECMVDCDSDFDCTDGEECYDFHRSGVLICAEARPDCSGDAAEADCECEFDSGTSSPIFLVTGTGSDCAIVERDQTACYSEWYDTYACVEQPETCELLRFYRYELGDGNALILHGHLSDITEGWINIGSGEFPMADCPILEGEF